MINVSNNILIFLKFLITLVVAGDVALFGDIVIQFH